MAVDSGTYTPETLARRYEMAKQLLAPNKEPIRNIWQGLSEIGQGALGGYQLHKTEELERQSRADAIAQALNAFGGGQGAPAAPVNSAPLPAPDASAPVADSTLPRGLRNNNPLNIEAGGFTQGQPGYSGSDGRFAKFDTPEAGTQAANNLLDVYQNKHGLNTVAGIVGRWAPAGDGNNVSAYAANVAHQLGIDPNAPIPPEMRPALIAAMGQHENGRSIGNVAAALNGGTGQQPVQVAGPPMAAPQPAQVASGGSPAPPPGAPVPPQGPAPTPLAAPSAPPAQGNRAAIAAMLNPWTPPGIQGALAKQINPEYGFQTLNDGTIVRTDPRKGTIEPVYQAPTKNTFGVIGENRDGQKIYGVINPEKGTATPVQVPGTANAPGATDTSGLTGEEYLKSLNDPGRADLIKGMVEGRMAPAQMGRFGTLAVQSLLKDAARYEPGFDNTTWSGRVAGIKDFYGGGKSQETVRKANQSALHFGELVDKMGALPGHDIPAANYVQNFVNTQLLGKGNANNFETNAHALADELSGLFKGAGISDAEIRAWESRLSPNMSEDQQRGMAKTLLGLYRDSASALEKKRQDALGPTLAARRAPVLGPEAEAALAKVEKFTGGQDISKAEPVKVASPEEARKLPKGTPIILPDGSLGVVP